MDHTTGQPHSPDNMPPTRKASVPAPAVQRLSLYLRELEAFHKQGVQTISSRQIGERLSLTDAQVRKDLAYFGQFGQAGIGYRVDELVGRIRWILGTDHTWNGLLVGPGNLGRALLSYRGFLGKGFHIVAAFDNDPALVGERIGVRPGVEVLPMERLAEVVADRAIQIAILCVPADVAQTVAEQVVAAGIKGILNFAPAPLSTPDDVAVVSVDLSVRLEQLAFRISARRLAEDAPPAKSR